MTDTRQAPAHLRSPHGSASIHFDALRGIAALGVCFSHLRDLFFQDYMKLPHHNPLLAAIYLISGIGHQWVIIFFVLSGYLVGGSVLRAVAVERWSWRSYLVNRLTRLYIVLFPALIFGGLFDLAGIHFYGSTGIYGGHTGNHELNFLVQSHLTVPILLGNYVFLQGIHVPTFGSNGPLWSLANEFWYYLLFPLLVFTVLPRITVARRLLNFVVLVAIVAFIHPQMALMGLIWLMGVPIHYLPKLPVDSVWVRRSLMIAGVILCFLALLWDRQSHLRAADYILGIAVSGLIYVILHARTPMPGIYNWAARILSRSSYTLYLVHVPLLVFLVAAINQPRWIPTAHSFLFGGAILSLLLLYTQLVWFFFERRTSAIREWIMPLILGTK